MISSTRSRLSSILLAILVGFGTIAQGLEAGIWDYTPSALWKKTYSARNQPLFNMAYNNGYIDGKTIDQLSSQFGINIFAITISPQLLLLMMIPNIHLRALTQTLVKSSDEYLIEKPHYTFNTDKKLYVLNKRKPKDRKPNTLREIIKNRLRDTLPHYLTKIIMIYIITHGLWISTKDGSWIKWALSFIGKTICRMTMTSALTYMMYAIIPEKPKTS